MALNKAFYGSYQSYNLTDYYFEIWIEDFDSTHGGSTFELKVGEGGPVITYDTDSEDRYNPILSSTLTMPLVITSAFYETNLVDKLYELWEERDVYIHLYQATSSTYSSTPPLWSGFVLMDLSSREDVGYPFDIEITATDGLALLKDEDWTDVDSWLAGSPATRPYDSGDVNWGPATFDYWIRNLLRRTYMATTAEGASENWEYSSSVNWYNEGHPAIAVNTDPLKNTTGKMTWTHSKDTQNVFTVANCYEALKQIMKVWGCRLVYWNHCFYIIQIDGYTTNESGTLAAPVNIMTRRYTYIGGDVGSGFNYLGELQLARYDLEINSNLTNGVPEGIVALKGTKFTHYPSIREVTQTKIYGGAQNYFGGFPEYVPTSFTNPDTPTSNPVAQHSIIDAASASEMRLSFSIETKHDSTHASTVEMTWWQRFYVKAYNDAGTTKYLECTGTNSGFAWVNSEPSMSDRPLIEATNVTRTFTVQNVFNETFPTDAAFTGLWHFELKLGTASWPSSGNWDSTGFYARRQMHSTPQYSRPYVTPRIQWRNAPSDVGGSGNYTVTTNQAGAIVFTGLLGNPFHGTFELVNSSTSSNGSTASIVTNTVATKDSEKYDFGMLFYADSNETTDESNLMVTDDGGTTYVKTAFSGKWGVSTLTGTDTITKLLATEFFSGQTENIQIFNGRLALSVNGKTTTFSGVEYMNYINPIGRLKHGTDYYIFRRGAFHTAFDEWDYEGWVIKDLTNTITTTSQDIWKSGFLGGSNGGGYSARLIAPPPGSTTLTSEQVITTTSSRISGASVTSIPIEEIGEAVLKNGDSIVLIDTVSRFPFQLTLAADQAASDTSLTISSYDFSAYPDIEAGALLCINTMDIVAQYQHKTKGTIGGMTVTANSIDGVGSLGRESVFFRFEGDNLSSGTYYVSNGEDNNKSGRWGSTNANAPSNIGTQRAIKSGRFVADDNYFIEAGSCVSSGTSGVTADVLLYKTTPVDGSTAQTAMTLMGSFTIALDSDARTQVDDLRGISTSQISTNDIIVPHIYSTSGSTYDLRGLITFRLKRYLAT